MPTLTPRPADWVDQAPVQATATRRIDAAPAAVWEYIADHERWPEWFDAIERVEVTGAAEGVGGRRRVIIGRIGLTVDEEFTEWEPERVFAFTVTRTSRPGLRSMNERLRLEPGGDGTRATYTMAFDPTPLLKPVLLLARPGLRKGVAAGLAGLARAVEASTAT